MEPHLLRAIDWDIVGRRKEVTDVASLKMTVTGLIVAQMGGELRVTYTPNKETHTVIRLPHNPASLISPQHSFKLRAGFSFLAEADWGAEMEEKMHLPGGIAAWEQRFAHLGGSKANRGTSQLTHRSNIAVGHCTLTEERRSQSDAIELQLLVVDDVELNRLVLMKMLDKFGWEITAATNGDEAVQAALKLVKRSSRLLIFMDIDMPIMNGIEATRHIRQACTLRRPFIVATTAYTAESVRRECMDAGMDYLIPKPVTHANIKQVFTLVSEAPF